jgi:beta-glucosidase
MPGQGYAGIFGDFFDGDLLSGVQNGAVPESRLDDMVLRILGPAMHLQGNFTESYPAPTFDINDVAGPTNNVRRDHYKVIDRIGQESVTLLKNNRTLGNHYGLPLRNKKAISSIAILGEDSGPKIHGYTSCGDFGTACAYDTPPGQNGTLSAGGGSGW